MLGIGKTLAVRWLRAHRSRKRYTIVLGLLLMLLFPSQVLATTCNPLEMRYILTCENGDCSTGFKVVGRLVNWGLSTCSQLSYVLDLDEGEIQDAVACAYSANIDIPSGIVEISLSEHFFLQDCTKYAQYIYVSQLSQEPNLSEWRSAFEEETLKERVALHVEVIASVAPVVIVGICVPLLFIARARDHRALSARATTAIIVQGILIGILFFIGMIVFWNKWYHISAAILFLGVCSSGVLTVWRRTLIT